MTMFKRSIRDFSEIAALIAEETGNANDSFSAAFDTGLERSRLGRSEAFCCWPRATC